VLGLENNLASISVAKNTASRLVMANTQFLYTDLFDNKQPLPMGYTQVLLDPPWDGADHVCQQLAKRKDVQRIVYVSCHLGSLMRDLAHLLAGGFKPQKVCLVDQFPQTYHIESMILLSR
jgi:23S rRNA (uracil1939-C5)-methyltransferase